MLGDMLRAERERQNLSIKDIEAGTSIRALYIECIENGDYGQLPGEVYTKGFIRNYASYLKMDADALVNQFVEENHPEQAAAKVAQEQAAKDKAADSSAKKQAGTVSAKPAKKDFGKKTEPVPKRHNLLLVGAVLLLAVAGGAYFLLSGEEQPVQPKAPQQAQVQQTETPAAAPAEPPKAEGVEVEAKLSDACWTQIKADGETVYEGTLEKGKTQVWKAKETLVVTAGNAGAIELKVNGKELGKAGNKGQVVEKTFTPEGEKPLADKRDSKKE